MLAVLARQGRILLVRRANPPDAGLWGFPGGRIEPGESIFAAAERELAEETGVEGRALRLLDALDVIRHDASGQLAHHFVLLAVECRWIAGMAAPADDALETMWLDPRAVREDDPAFSAGLTRVLERLRQG